jgi:hypothetical protein
VKTLDLHGYRHWEVPNIIHSFVNHNLGIEIKIIFGHSPKMRDLVLETLSPYNFRVTRNDLLLNKTYITILTK